MDELIIRLIPLVQSCVLLLILLVVVGLASRLFRVNLAKTELRPADYLESFRKLQEEGKLTDEEFRIIRTLVSLQINRSLDSTKPDFSLLNKIPPNR